MYSFLTVCFIQYAAHSLALPPFTRYDDVRPVLNALRDSLPADLRVLSESLRRAAWTNWVMHHDRDIRVRLSRGDDDTIVNWLLFGTSFTREPRAILDTGATSDDLPRVISARTADLVAALASANPDERRVFARDLLRRKGFRLDTIAELERIEKHLHSEVERVVAEQQEYARRLNAAILASDVSEELAERSRLFRDRGLSLDTSMLPGFAIEQALQAMKNQRLLAGTDIRRVAIIGPGLDFADKNFGYDFYPVQTLQPFMLIDSLLRLRLAARPKDIELVTLDISTRVNDHLRALRDHALAGRKYVLQLPLDPGSAWSPGVTAFWRTLGDRVGEELRVPQPPSIGKQMENRGIGVRPEIAARVTPADFNVVTQKWPGKSFDLVIATNVFVYYDKLDQSLAFSNVEAMLRPGGVFLTNNPIVELPNSRLRSVGALQVQYSLEPARNDFIFWYRRLR